MKSAYELAMERLGGPAPKQREEEKDKLRGENTPWCSESDKSAQFLEFVSVLHRTWLRHPAAVPKSA